MFRAPTTAIVVLTLLAASGPSARAQFRGGGGGGIGAGSTPIGDMERGAGILMMGAGIGNYYNAMGNSINTDTWMRLNEYIFQSVREASMREEKRLAERIAKNKENYKEWLERVLNNPDHLDLKRGDALNAIYRELTNPKINDSAFRLSPVQISGENIRGIPFVYAPRAATICLQRLTARGKWPVGLRGDKFVIERRNYERAIDNALEQQREGKISPEALQAVEKAVYDLKVTLDQVIAPGREPIYLEAKNYLKRLDDMKETFKYQKVEEILGAIDKYSGTTVKELVDFMKTYSLQFGVPDDIGDEQKLYARLYASLRQQLDLVEVPKQDPIK